MFKKYLLILTLILIVPSCYALDLQLNYTSLGPGQSFIGFITLPPGDYNPDAIIKLSTQDSSDSKKLEDVIDCDEVDCEGVIDYYRSTGESTTELQGTDILTGIRIPKDVTQISNAIEIAKKYETAPGKPRVIIADTIKGYPISFMMKDAINWHAGHLDEELYKECMKELGLCVQK